MRERERGCTRRFFGRQRAAAHRFIRVHLLEERVEARLRAVASLDIRRQPEQLSQARLILESLPELELADEPAAVAVDQPKDLFDLIVAERRHERAARQLLLLLLLLDGTRRAGRRARLLSRLVCGRSTTRTHLLGELAEELEFHVFRGAGWVGVRVSFPVARGAHAQAGLAGKITAACRPL